MHLTSTATVASQTIAMSEDSAAGSGRQAFTFNGNEHANVLVVNRIAYIEGDQATMASFFGFQPALAARLAGRWISFRPGDSGGGTNYATVTAGVTLAGVAEELNLTGRLSFTAATVLTGLPRPVTRS